MGKRALRGNRRGRSKAVTAAAADQPRRGPGRPVGASADRTRDRILEAAIEAFAEHGFAGCSIRDIARQARIRSSSLYHYFTSKEALYEAVLQRMQDEIRGLVFSTVGSRSHDLRVMSREATGKIFDFFLANRAYVKFGLHLRLEGVPLYDRRINDRWLGFMEAMMQPAEADGTVKTFDPAMLIMTVDGLVQWHIASDQYYRTVFGKGLDDPEIAARVREHVIQVVTRTMGLD